ncbi:MAG: hypothetical protein WBE45_11045, partial [Terriglobales bacterium]
MDGKRRQNAENIHGSGAGKADMRGASVTQESERVEDVSDRQLAINLFYAQNPSMSEMAWSIKGDVKNIFSLHRGRGIVRAIQPSRHW